MKDAWILSRGHQRIAIEGTLNCDTVVALLADSRPRFVGTERLEIDLKGVRSANSAGLALLLEWSELAHKAGVSLRFDNPPPALLRLASLCNVSALLALADVGA